MWFHLFEKWLTEHSATVQAVVAIFGAILTLILVATTIAYLVESHKSRVAAEQQAASARESLAILKREYEDRLGEGPGIVKHAIEASLKVVADWKGQATLGSHHPERVADPTNLIPPELLAALGHARRISLPCADHINAAIGEMRQSIAQLQTLRQSPDPNELKRLSNSKTLPRIFPAALDSLDRAQQHLRGALSSLEIVQRQPPENT
jgi:hypothetical protein